MFYKLNQKERKNKLDFSCPNFRPKAFLRESCFKDLHVRCFIFNYILAQSITIRRMKYKSELTSQLLITLQKQLSVLIFLFLYILKLDFSIQLLIYLFIRSLCLFFFSLLLLASLYIFPSVELCALVTKLP